MTSQNNREHLIDLMQRSELTPDQANVQMVRSERFRLVINSLPASVRKALNAAVKSGELGRFKKEGHKPECYYHPTFDYLAKEARSRHERRIQQASSSVITRMSDL